MLQSSVRREAIPFFLDPARLALDGGGYQRRLVGGAAKNIENNPHAKVAGGCRRST